MKGRTNEEGIEPVTDAPADNAEMGGMDGVKRSQNLAEACKRVMANKGAPDMEGMTIDDVPAFAREQWTRIACALTEGTITRRQLGGCG